MLLQWMSPQEIEVVAPDRWLDLEFGRIAKGTSVLMVMKPASGRVLIKGARILGLLVEFSRKGMVGPSVPTRKAAKNSEN